VDEHFERNGVLAFDRNAVGRATFGLLRINAADRRGLQHGYLSIITQAQVRTVRRPVERGRPPDRAAGRYGHPASILNAKKTHRFDGA
jgi:hypothetical protein